MIVSAKIYIFECFYKIVEIIILLDRRMTYPIKYTHIKNNSDKLLVFFNDDAKVGTLDNTFSSFKILNFIFGDYDILFVKDIKTMH